MPFLETPRFPEKYSAGARGGPGWATTVQGLASGAERRNQRWKRPRYGYTVGRSLTHQADIDVIVDFFNAVRGMTDGFRFKDFREFSTNANRLAPTPTDSQIGTGDGSQTAFQLAKVTTVGANTFTREIYKPVAGTVRVAVDGAEQGTPAVWTVSTATGIVTFGTAPAAGAVISAGFEFDVPVRFDVDNLEPELHHFEAGAFDVPLIEIREIA